MGSGWAVSGRGDCRRPKGLGHPKPGQIRGQTPASSRTEPVTAGLSGRNEESGPKSLREARPSPSRSFLEFRTRHSGLADDRHQRAGAQLSMIRHRNGDRAVGSCLLHRDVAAAPPDFDETVGGEDAADLATGQNAQSSQLRPQSGSHRLRRVAACQLRRWVRFRKTERGLRPGCRAPRPRSRPG